MKNLLFVCFFWFSCFCLTAQEVEINGCQVTIYHTWDRGSSTSFYAYGNVYVETDPTEPVDFDVEIVDQPKFSDFCVYKTTYTPKECCEWRFVSDRKQAKFVIRYVKEHADCYVYFVKERKDAGTNYLVRIRN
ncbi:MAG: hypothetical protein PHR53_09310 [Bacteroidales bacterium]|nr:hypothetical protein [Bacteroidales bacterium]